MVSVSVSKNFGIEKKYRYRFRKILVSKKVSVSVSKNFGIEKSIGFGFEKFWYRKKYRIRYRKNLVSEKSFGFGFVQILGIVTHCRRMGSWGTRQRSDQQEAEDEQQQGKAQQLGRGTASCPPGVRFHGRLPVVGAL